MRTDCFVWSAVCCRKRGERVSFYRSTEDYLRCIQRLSEQKPAVRAIDIARELGYAKSSVSVALKKLADEGYVSIDENLFIWLTEMGRVEAEKSVSRHEILSRSLIAIGADAKVAEQEACRLEHIISDEICDLLKAYYDKQLAESAAPM